MSLYQDIYRTRIAKAIAVDALMLYLHQVTKRTVLRSEAESLLDQIVPIQ